MGVKTVPLDAARYTMEKEPENKSHQVIRSTPTGLSHDSKCLCIRC